MKDDNYFYEWHCLILGNERIVVTTSEDDSWLAFTKALEISKQYSKERGIENNFGVAFCEPNCRKIKIK